MLNTQLLPTLIALLACHEALTLPTATGRTGQHLATSTNSTGLDHIQQETCPNANEEIVLTMSGQLKCCVKCPAGEGMLQLCTNHTQTVCRTCQEFSEFSPVASATAKCMQCKQCQELHPFAKFRTHCTPTSDAVCECIPGYFFVEAQSTCQSCTKCPPGHGAERPCDWNRDSLCKPCPAGTWSSSTSATETCQTCRKCKPGQIEMRPCSATHNTLCCPLHEPNCSDTLEMDAIRDEPSQTNRRQATGDQMPDHVAYGDDYPMITVYCSLLGLVILTLLIYVFYKLWQQHLTAVDAKAGMVEAAGGNALHPAFAELTKSRSVSAATSGHSSLSKQKASAASRPDCVRQHLLSESTQYSSLPQRPPISSELMEELSQALSADDRWKQVGGMLGYSDEALQRFENSSEHENDDVTKETTGATVAARRMLSSWFASRPSTETNPLESLISVIELIPGTANLCVLLKEYSSVKSPPPHPPLGQPH
uniref:Death domain-containing protein n=1 Tax=Mesocestoides corti TaxID=53468 RepID=A0A5K3FMD9_MESCO